MACVALTSLIKTIEIEFVQPTPIAARARLSLHDHDQPLIKSFLENLSCLQAFLQNKNESSGDGDGGALRDIEVEIRDFALKAEDDIELQLSNMNMNSSSSSSSSIKLCKNEAAKNAAELLSEREMACVTLTSLIRSIEICDALKAKHDIEIQLSKREKACLKLHQTLEEAAKNEAELLLESCVSERERASAALTILITKLKHCINLPRFPTLYFGGAAAMVSFLEKLSSLQAFLLQHEEGNSNSNDSIKKLETKIRAFALKAEDVLQIQLTNFLLAKEEANNSQKLRQTWQKAALLAAELLKSIKKEKASQKLHQTMQKAAESAEELLNIINSSSRRRSNEEVDDYYGQANHETQPLKHAAAASKSANVVESDGDGSSSVRIESVVLERNHN